MGFKVIDSTYMPSPLTTPQLLHTPSSAPRALRARLWRDLSLDSSGSTYKQHVAVEKAAASTTPRAQDGRNRMRKSFPNLVRYE
jgi:hypothetical protein